MKIITQLFLPCIFPRYGVQVDASLSIKAIVMTNPETGIEWEATSEESKTRIIGQGLRLPGSHEKLVRFIINEPRLFSVSSKIYIPGDAQTYLKQMQVINHVITQSPRLSAIIVNYENRIVHIPMDNLRKDIDYNIQFIYDLWQNDHVEEYPQIRYI